MCPCPAPTCHISLVTDYTFLGDKFFAPFFGLFLGKIFGPLTFSLVFKKFAKIYKV